MDKKQVVTINTMHTCPMTTGNTPHVGGPIIGPGCSTATLNGIPIALQGDKCICAAGGQDVILQGCPTATINGVPIALQGSPTAHGGTIPAGVPGAVIISKNTLVLEAGAEGEPAVYNLQWVKEEQIIRNSKIEKVVTLVADARNIPNGEEVTVKVHTPEQDGGSSMLTELKGIVQDNQVQVEWKVEQKEENENAPKVTDFYLSDDKNKKISKIKYNEEHIFLHINTKNLQGKTFSIKINSPYLEYKHKDTVLNEQILKDYSITSDEEVIELQLNKPFKKGVKKTVSKFTLSIGKIGYEKTLSLKIKREEKCVVTFSLDETQDNLFGFDSYEISKVGCESKKKLQKVYREVEEIKDDKKEEKKFLVCGKEYLRPWISLGKGAEAILKVEVKTKGNFNNITFSNSEGHFTFTPSTLKEGIQDVKITCNTLLSKNYEVNVLADGEIAGGLLFMENSVKKFVIQPIYVFENSNDKKNIETFANNELLKEYFKKAFTSSLIECILEVPLEINISDPELSKEKFYATKFQSIKNNRKIVVKDYQENSISSDSRFLLIADIRDLYNSLYLNKEDIKSVKRLYYPLFLTNFECKIEYESSDHGDNNGITPSPNKYASFIFLGNSVRIPNIDIPHEVMHGLGLEHTFDPKSNFVFTKGDTANYMDYKSKNKTVSAYAQEKHNTFKWQWILLRTSKKIKELLPFLSILVMLFLVSCSSYKNISCEYDYSPAKDEMVLDSTLIPSKGDFSKEIRINNYIKMRIGKSKNEITKYISIDTFGIVLRRFVMYSTSKKINYTFYSIGKPLGKEYHFDEAGNITKVIDNDKGFPICWQQALFIAKKNVGKASDWHINKENYKGKNCWEIYYHKRRDRFLLIDAQSGKIVKKGFSGIATDDVIYDNTF